MGGKKKGFGSMLKGIFVEQVDIDDDELTDEELSEQMNSGGLPVTQQNHPMPDVKEPKAESAPEITINKNIVNAIKAVMDENDLEGYDYKEFMRSIEEQKDLPSEKKKFEVVFSVVKGMGVSKQHLVDTADHYLNIVLKHKEEFTAKIDSEESEKVVKLKNEAEAIEGSITQKTDQIEALKQEIEALHNKKVEVLEVASENEAEILKLRQEGDYAYKIFTDKIKDGKRKINEYVSDERETNGTNE